ncbi:FtsX-like permease family protein [Zunongwangia sp. HRR-M8]|uniref:FtsX-like permease family protein n=1 Tax=Zunongwangia sp. HRR-M8 TaxID=3015170 RepID=UPI0022DD8E67|nr:FtsX-like permease family protein [Zunongwangia sp. HRR-M8]WBL22292.1 ABC transporter permease [Zunongwangia sp. HRR-M8]
MLRNYIKIAWRNLWRNTLTSILSLIGLIVGVMCFFLLGTYILNELRYDRFHKKADRIVYVNYNYKSASDAEATHSRYTPTAVAPVAKRELFEVEDAVRIYNYDRREVEVDNKHFTEHNMILADASIFNIFSFDFVSGNPVSALDRPNTVIITKTTASRYFQEQPALGKSIVINDKIWEVTGIVKDNLPYSSIQFDLMGSYQSSKRSESEIWNSANDYSYLLLKNAQQRVQAEQKLNTFVAREFKEDFQSGFTMNFDFVPLQEDHLSAAASGNLKTYLFILGAIAVLLLTIAAINFTNLMTSKSIERLKEIGVRKVMGAPRKSLIAQFLTEAAVLTILAIITGTLAALIVMPSFNKLTGLNISLASWDWSYFVITLIVLFYSVTLLAGGWPALVLSRFKPVVALKNSTSALGKGGGIRKFLIVFQFTVSVVFIIGTLVAKKQLHFITEIDTGFNRANVIVVDANSMRQASIEAFKKELLASKNVANVTTSSHTPVDMQGGYSIQVDGQPSGISITAAPVDKDYIKTLDMRLIAGNDFNETDKKQVQIAPEKRTYAFMLNETAVNHLGYSPEEAVGKAANLNGRSGYIKGVLQDFNFVSLHQSITPVALFAEYDWAAKVLIKTQGNAAKALSEIEKVWEDFNPDSALTYSFLDQDYQNLYKSEQRTILILNVFAAITILVSCLGLFGLSFFMAAQRKKEIGIRKALGASIAQITYLLSINFLKLITIALCFAVPLAWFITAKWLQDFAYKIAEPYELYILSAGIAITIALLTLSFQAIKAAIANPVKSLRTE